MTRIHSGAFVLASSFLAISGCKSAPPADTNTSAAPTASATATASAVSIAPTAPVPSASASSQPPSAVWNTMIAAMTVQPGRTDATVDPKGVACAYEAALSKEALPPDLVWGRCASTIDDCKELEPFPDTDVADTGFDAEAQGGPVFGVLLYHYPSMLAEFAGLDGVVKNAVELHPSKEDGAVCKVNALVVGGGRYALDIKSSLPNPHSDDGFDPGFEVLWVALGNDGAMGRPAQTSAPLPDAIGARLAMAGGLKVWPGSGSFVDDVDTNAVLVRGVGLGLRKDNQVIQMAKLPSNAVLATAAPGSSFVSLGASFTSIAWMEKASDGCVLVTSPFADTAEKLAPKRIGRVPCVPNTSSPMILGGGYASYETRLVRLKDGQSFDLAKACSTRECSVSVIGITATEVFIETTTPHPRLPIKKLLRIPIASLGAGTEAVDAGAAMASPGDAGTGMQDAGVSASTSAADAAAPTVDAGVSH